MAKGLQRVKEGPRTNIVLESLRAILKKVVNRKIPGHDSMRGF